MNETKQKHFKVIYGKVLGIPVGNAEPITPEGKRIALKYFIPFFVSVGIAVFFSGSNALVFMTCWFTAALSGYLFIRQLKHTATFERQYFFKRD